LDDLSKNKFKQSATAVRLITLISIKKDLNMNKINTIITALVLLLAAVSAANASDSYTGFSVNSARSEQPGVTKDSALGFNGIVSHRMSDLYGYDFQLGMFGATGPFKQSTYIDATIAGYVPMGSSVRLYGKVGVADVFSQGSTISANRLSVTYGAGLEFQKRIAIIRVGFQHYDVANESPSISTNIVGISLLVK